MRPPWRRPLKPSGNKEEMVMVGGYTNYLRRCRSSFIQCIPDEVLFEILLRLPAQDIYFGARLVCCKWYHMMRSTNFIHKHLERASSGLVCMDDSDNFVFISAREDGGLDTYKLNFMITDPEGDREMEKKISEKYKVTCKIITSHRVRFPVWSSWNGLVLESDRTHTIYHVTNILTDQVFRLPQCPYAVAFSACCIGYDAASMTYKVVVSYSGRAQYRCGILTLGVDKSWRIVHTDHLSDFAKTALLSNPFNTDGFVHWSFQRGTFLILNLETEIISEISPPVVLEQNSRLCFLPSTRHVSHFVRRGGLVWEVFEMKPEIGEWKRLPNMCMEGQKGKIEMLVGFSPMHQGVHITPRGWLKYPEVLALSMAMGSVGHRRAFIIFYNLITCEIGANMLSISGTCQRVTPYKNSLVLRSNMETRLRQASNRVTTLVNQELGHSKLGQFAETSCYGRTNGELQNLEIELRAQDTVRSEIVLMLLQNFSCTVKNPSQTAMETLITKSRSAKRPLVVVGCVPQGSRDLKELEGVSIVGVQQIDRVVEVVEETLKGREVRLLTRKTLPTLTYLPKVRKNKFVEILPINVGFFKVLALIARQSMLVVI